MKKILIWAIIVFLLSFSFVNSHGEETFETAEHLINEKIPCSELSDEQLEVIGDYYMEKMHPGEAHEAMDNMMGGEGSESLKQAHIQMAETHYCDNFSSSSFGMMGNYGGMMGMMNNIFNPFGLWMGGFGFMFMLIFWIAVIWIIAYLIRESNKPKRRRYKRK